MKASKFSLYLSFLVIFCAMSCKEEGEKAVQAAPISFQKEGDLIIYKAKTDSIIASFEIEIADNDYETETGLMYRKAMKSNRGMLFIFPNSAMHSFYMKNTAISLDILFIDEHMQIASLQENAKPYNESSLSSKVPVKYVLELNAGLSEKLNLKVKDSISFTKL